MNGAADRLARLAPWAGLFALTAGLSLVQIQALDYWWHLKTGQLIAATGEVPLVDAYTYSVPGARYVDIHWLHQLGLFTIYRLAGHPGVVVAQTVLVLATFGLLATVGARRDRAVLSAVVLGVAAMLAAARFTPRPEVTSFLLLASVVALLDRFERRGDAWIYAVVPVQLVWANVHGLFATGLALCAIPLVAEGLRPLAGGLPIRWTRVRRLGTVLVLSTAASTLTPNGIDGALYPVTQLEMIRGGDARGFFAAHIVELAPTLSATSPLGLALFFGLAAASLAAMLANRSELRLADPLTWVSFLYLALGAKRNVSLFAIVAAPILVRNANAWLDRVAIPPRAWRWTAAAGSVLLLGLAADAFTSGLHPRLGQWRTTGVDVAPDFRPKGAVDWIEEHRPPGPIAHDMGLGSYLIWRLHPDYRVLIDGRLEVFGAETFERLWIQDMDDFRTLDAEFHFGTVLSRDPNRDGEVDLIAGWFADPAWRLVYVDDRSTVFVREPNDYAAVDLDADDLFPRLDASRGMLDVQRLNGRVRLFAALGLNERALREWERGLEVFPDLVNADDVRRILRQRIAASRPGRS